jgi:hypothetical protein
MISAASSETLYAAWPNCRIIIIIIIIIFI